MRDYLVGTNTLNHFHLYTFPKRQESLVISSRTLSEKRIDIGQFNFADFFSVHKFNIEFLGEIHY